MKQYVHFSVCRAVNGYEDLVPELLVGTLLALLGMKSCKIREGMRPCKIREGMKPCKTREEYVGMECKDSKQYKWIKKSYCCFD